MRNRKDLPQPLSIYLLSTITAWCSINILLKALECNFLIGCYINTIVLRILNSDFWIFKWAPPTWKFQNQNSSYRAWRQLVSCLVPKSSKLLGLGEDWVYAGQCGDTLPIQILIVCLNEKNIHPPFACKLSMLCSSVDSVAQIRLD